MTAGTIGIGYAPVPSAPEHWMERGTCTTMDPRIWDEAWTLATAHCNQCPVLDDCRAWVLGDGYALTRGEGVIAGLDPKQRDQHIREQGAQARTARLCAHCHTPLPPEAVHNKRYHEDCRRVILRERSREQNRRGSKNRYCRDCADPVGPRKLYCTPCRDERRKETLKRNQKSQQEARKRRDHAAYQRRWRRTCKQCGYEAKESLGKARLCAECRHLNSIRQRKDAS